MNGPGERRGSTPRWWLAVPVALSLTLAVGLQQLVTVAPETTVDLDVTGQLAGEPVHEVRRCTLREADRPIVEEVRAAVPAGSWVTSSVVVNCPEAFDQREIRYVGELIGDLLERDGGAWVLINDDDYALEVGPLWAHHDHRGTNSGLAVWLPADLLDRVSAPGRPGLRGEVVEVVGTVQRTDPADGGGLTLRARELRVVAPAVAVDDPVDVPQLVFAVATLLLAGVLWRLRRRATRPTR